MVVERYAIDVEGFNDAWMEMYDNHVVKLANKLDVVENNVITSDEKELRELFEETYNCELYQRNVKGHHYWYDFDTVRFPSESAYTMFLLKWA